MPSIVEISMARRGQKRVKKLVALGALVIFKENISKIKTSGKKMKFAFPEAKGARKQPNDKCMGENRVKMGRGEKFKI